MNIRQGTMDSHGILKSNDATNTDTSLHVCPHFSFTALLPSEVMRSTITTANVCQMRHAEGKGEKQKAYGVSESVAVWMQKVLELMFG